MCQKSIKCCTGGYVIGRRCCVSLSWLCGIEKLANWVGNVNFDPKILNMSSHPYLTQKGFTREDH